MKKIYLSSKAHPMLQEYLTELGYHIESINTEGIVDSGISCHPDIFMCKLGVEENAPVFHAEKGEIGYDYPQDVAFNGACTGKYFLHKLDSTNGRLLAKVKEMGMELIDVRQGYTKCSIVIVDENSIITYDEGIAKSCEKYEDLNVLLISPGFIRLDGYDTGFIGGCSGRVGNEIIFNGDLSNHPDFMRIVSFVNERGIACKWFKEYKLTDIGSIIPAAE